MVLAFCCCRASFQGWAVKRWLLVPAFSAREWNLCCCAWYQVDASFMDINVNYIQFLGAFAKLRKATISFVMSVCVRLSVRTEQLGSHWTDFHEI
jgi:hypothetical protein